MRNPLTIMASPFALMLVCLIRLVRPLVLIRFQPILSNRIGHFAGNIEIYLSDRDYFRKNKRSLDIFYHAPVISNQQLKVMWDRTLHVWRFARLIDRINRLIPGGQAHVIPQLDRDVDGVVELVSQHIYFNEEEEQLGKRALTGFGITGDIPHVCFHARDSSYLDKAFPNQAWDQHEIRNSSIHNYLPAMEKLANHGYVAFRMGAVVHESLETNVPNVFDYATYHRTDFLDIYLSATCRFYVCSATGVERLPLVFRRPAVFVNWIPLDYVNAWGSRDLFIPKRLWLTAEQRWLTFKEILDSGVGRFLESERYHNAGIEVIENTPEEILDVVLEMDQRLNGVWDANDEDEDLQARFWSLFESNSLHRVFRIRIGSKFLRQNEALLG